MESQLALAALASLSGGKGRGPCASEAAAACATASKSAPGCDGLTALRVARLLARSTSLRRRRPGQGKDQVVSKKRIALLAVIVVVLSGVTAAASPQVAKSTGSCSKIGHVIWIKGSDVPGISGACWTLEEPASDRVCSGTTTTTCPIVNTYTFCRSSSTAELIVAGDEWVYDDVNPSGHADGTDQQIDAGTCKNHGQWTYEFMAAQTNPGSFHYAWYPQVVFEENYLGDYAFVPYTLSTSAESGITSTPSPYNPVPTLNADDAAQNIYAPQVLTDKIAALCYKAPTGANGGFPPNYYFGLYSGTQSPAVSQTRLANIKYELNQCYH